MKSILKILFLLSLCAILAAGAWLGTALPQKQESEVNMSEVDALLNNIAYAVKLGAETVIPTETEARRQLLLRRLLEQEFEARDIRLTEEEQQYTESYLTERYQELNEMIARGGSEKENAELVLDMLEQYMRQTNLTREEYAQEIQKGLAFQLNYQKLLKQTYHGNTKQLLQTIMQKHRANSFTGK